MKNKILICSCIGTSILFNACDNTNDTVITENLAQHTITGQFINPPVQGLNYFCSSNRNGITNINSEYTCNPGDTVEFKIGTFSIGSVIATKITTPLTLHPHHMQAKDNTLHLLKIMDNDKNPSNGVELDIKQIQLLNNSNTTITITSNIKDFKNKLLVKILGLNIKKSRATLKLDVNNIKSIVSNNGAFAALKKDATVVTWGEARWGGDSSGVDLNNTKAIFSTAYAFAALKKDDTVVTWGTSLNGADSSEVNLNNTKEIFSTDYAFAALKKDGTVVTWGESEWGGDSSELDLNNTKMIFSTEGAFAALKNDNTVVTWGYREWGGDSSGVDLNNTETILSNNRTFVALKKDGTAITWDYPDE